jgi:hypothetical protein
VAVKFTGYEKFQVIVMISETVDRRKLTPFGILNRENLPMGKLHTGKCNDKG